MSSEAQHTPGAPASHSERHCVHCGTSTEPTWEFCGGCGAPIGTARTAPDQPTASVLTAPVPVLTTPPAHEKDADARRPVVPAPTGAPPPRRSRGRTVVAVLLVLVLLGLATAAGFWQKQTHDELLAAKAQLDSTQGQLAQRSAALSDVEGQLDQTRNRLFDTRGRLSEVQDSLDQKLKQLRGLKGSLTNAQSRLDLQANQIETLKNCLNGVSSSLGYAASNNYTAALAALDAVQVSCQRAGDML